MIKRVQFLVLCALSAALSVACERNGTGGSRPSSAEGSPQHAQLLTVLHLGDSHTAVGHFSGHLRVLFQERFGRGPRGMLPPGAIYDGYQPHQVSLQIHGKWRLFGAWHTPNDGPFGLSEYRLTASRRDARLTYEVSPQDRFTHVRIGVYGGPGSGGLMVQWEGARPRVIQTRTLWPGFVLKTISLGRAVTRITLSPSGDGPVSLFSVSLERAGGGVTYVSHGVPGATVELLARMDERIVERELQALDPDLIILAFGTNEGYDASLDETAYKRLFETQVSRLQKLAPRAHIAVVGPPDANRLSGPARKQGSADRGPGTCLTDAQDGASNDPLPSTYWSVPGMLKTVRRIQRQVAEDRGSTFWDWSSVMGGPCGMHDWANAVPPKAFADHVHMTGAGAAESARRLFDFLMTSYGEEWGSAPHADDEETP